MADIELVIKIPEEAKQAFDCAESNDLKGCYYDHGGVIGNAIKNGTPLPKGHGRIGDLDQILIWMIYGKGIINKLKCGEVASVFKDATIIEADEAERDEVEQALEQQPTTKNGLGVDCISRLKTRVNMVANNEEDDYKKVATDIDDKQNSEKLSCLRYVFEIPDATIWFNANLDNLDAIYVKHKGVTKEYKLKETYMEV